MSFHNTQTAFEEHVTSPLERLVGTALRFVEYYALDCDMPGFDASVLVESGGCQGVHLVFDGGEVEVDWGFSVRELRDPTGFLAYYLTIRTLSEPRGPENLQGLNVVDATGASPWDAVVGEPLLSATVLGSVVEGGRAIPQAVEFTFSSGSIFVVIGWPGQWSGDTRSIGPCDIGDGDEVLVFSAEQWAHLLPGEFMAKCFPEPLWQAQSGKT